MYSTPTPQNVHCYRNPNSVLMPTTCNQSFQKTNEYNSQDFKYTTMDYLLRAWLKTMKTTIYDNLFDL